MKNIIDNLPSKEELMRLIQSIQEHDLPSLQLYGVPEEDEFIDITVASNGTDPNDWGFQTGDNSYSGACYFYRHWAVGYIDDQTNPEHLAIELLDQLEELVAYEQLDC